MIRNAVVIEDPGPYVTPGAPTSPVLTRIPMTAGVPIAFGPVQDVEGFGIRFAPLRDGDVWRLRVRNSPVGHMSYAPSQRFSVNGTWFQLSSPGDEIVEYHPVDAPEMLRITPAHDGWYAALMHPPTMTYRAPTWTETLWLGGSWKGLNEQRVLDDLADMVRHGLHLTVRMIDYGWQSDDAVLRVDPHRFPHPRELIQSLTDAGMRTVLWWSPWIASGTAAWREARDCGWLVRDAAGDPLVFSVVGDDDVVGSYLDFTSQAVADMLDERLGALLALGVAGLKFDFGESLPDHARFAGEVVPADRDGFPTVLSRNSYVVCAEHLLERCLRAHAADACLISRAGWTHSEHSTGVWLGDQSSDVSRYAGLRSLPHAYQSALQMGYASVGVDIGGYWDEPTLTTYQYWHQLAACTSFATYHGLSRRAPWTYGRAGLTVYHQCIELRGLIGCAGQESPNSRVRIARTADHGLIRQFETANAIVPLAFDQQHLQVQLPAGRWQCYPTGEEIDGDSLHHWTDLFGSASRGSSRDVDSTATLTACIRAEHA